jgi:lysophospholipase L1-like esterase
VFALLSLVALVPGADPLVLKDGDRVVWIGSTIAERERRYGYWETALHAAFPKVNFTFRNLGWSGDTVWGESRAGFDTPTQGFQRLVGLTLELKPTVIFVNYGTNEAFEGEAGLPKFEKGLEKLLDALKPANARIVLFTPMPFESNGRSPDMKSRNTASQKYAEAVRTVAADRKLSLADFATTLSKRYDESERLRQAKAIRDDERLTDDGMHLTAGGYHDTTLLFLQSLGLIGEQPSCTTGVETPAVLKELRKDLEPLRKAVVAKNQLFFYRWRPQNETYLFGFRKHEQGKNAKEVAEFDPLVDKAEKEIELIKKDLSTK